MNQSNGDQENCSNDKRVKKALEPGENYIDYRQIHLQYNSTKLFQQNSFQNCASCQNKEVLTPSEFKYKIHRKINIARLEGISVSRYGFEFILHVPQEYDYRYSSQTHRDQILQAICKSYCEFHKDLMAFYFYNDLTLSDFTTSKIDKQQKIVRMPKIDPDYLKPETLSLIKSKSQVEFKQEQSTNKTVTIDDFSFLKVLGRGAFGKVMLCEHRKTKKLYAVKALNKEIVLQKNQLQSTWTEREILTTLSHPFLVTMDYAFKSETKIFFALPFVRGGEMFYHLKNQKLFPEDQARFYAVQLIMALDYLHKNGYVYRDLKPENILLNEDGYLTLADFGLAKKLEPGQQTNSFVGTPDYIAPEVLKSANHDFNVDWWAIGIIIYEMLVGFPPFYHNNVEQLYILIAERDIRFPNIVKADAKDLITKLLNKNPSNRLGAQKGGDEIFAHPWFSKVNLEDIYRKKYDAPFKPKLKGKYDVNNFDEEFTTEGRNIQKPIFSQVQENKLLQKHFEDFNGMSFIKQ